MSCHCGNKVDYSQCCEPMIQGKKLAQTAEQLLRSRYSAFAAGEVDYITKTHDPDTAHEYDADETKAWSEQSTWLGLEIKEVFQGGQDDAQGEIEFVAKYKQNGQSFSHHEQSNFTKKEGQWYFTDAQVIHEPVRRDESKVGRNDPCPCGSGKKYKKCCL